MNENAKSVICDYCGEEMKLIWTVCCSERKGGFFQFQCPECFACTPRVKTQVDYYKEKPSDKELEEGREAAYDAAMKRERPKAKNIGADYAEQDQFICSKCGIHLQDWVRIDEDDYEDEIVHEYVFRFCPNCGKKLEEIDDEK